jgi:hypothetical protein
LAVVARVGHGLDLVVAAGLPRRGGPAVLVGALVVVRLGLDDAGPEAGTRRE